MSDVDWDELARSKSLRSVIDPLDMAGMKNSLIDEIHWNAISGQLERHETVLDFGCGVGRFTQRLVDHGLKYHGVDASTGMIESAKQMNSLNNAQFIHSSRLPLPFSDGFFDVCLSVWVLQYLMQQRGDERRSVFSELARVLSPGGKLLVIEQASAAGRSSGTVEVGSTEGDYVEALSGSFIVEQVETIRCCRMTMLSSMLLRCGNALPLKHLAIEFMAKLEARQALNAGPDRLKSMDYYDICINAVKK